MLATERNTETITITLADAAKAFREGAEEIASSAREAEILATAALLNYLVSERPELFEQPLKKVRKAALVSSLS